MEAVDGTAMAFAMVAVSVGAVDSGSLMTSKDVSAALRRQC
jgi:hypothetical protein